MEDSTSLRERLLQTDNNNNHDKKSKENDSLPNDELNRYLNQQSTAISFDNKKSMNEILMT